MRDADQVTKGQVVFMYIPFQAVKSASSKSVTISARTQAYLILELMLARLRKNPNEKFGLYYSANDIQTKDIQDAIKDQKIPWILGANQADVVNQIQRLLYSFDDRDDKFESLRGRFEILPFTTVRHQLRNSRNTEDKKEKYDKEIGYVEKRLQEGITALVWFNSGLGFEFAGKSISYQVIDEGLTPAVGGGIAGSYSYLDALKSKTLGLAREYPDTNAVTNDNVVTYQFLTSPPPAPQNNNNITEGDFNKEASEYMVGKMPSVSRSQQSSIFSQPGSSEESSLLPPSAASFCPCAIM